VRLIPQNSMFSNFCHLLKKKLKSAGRCSVYLNGGIAKRPIRNKQSTPTPEPDIYNPILAMELTYDKHERLHRLLFPLI
uniref:hypothetical protein n=1 Tax=uncultured Duncaniella sp. TaxID=2768039 RepID=UPI0025AF2119